MLGQKSLKQFRLYFGPNDDTKRTFSNELTFRRTHQGGEKNTYVRERIGRGFRCTNGRGDKKQKWCDHNHVYQPIVKVGFTLSEKRKRNIWVCVCT